MTQGQTPKTQAERMERLQDLDTLRRLAVVAANEAQGAFDEALSSETTIRLLEVTNEMPPEKSIGIFMEMKKALESLVFARFHDAEQGG